MVRRAGFVAALTAASFLLFGGEAAAATSTVGQDFEAGGVICGNQTDLQTSVSSGNSYTVGAAGVITSWSFHNGIDVLPGLKLKVARPQSGGGYLFIGEAAAGTQILHALNTYPANIPVQVGDVIGIFVGSPFGHCGTFTSSVTPLTSSAATPRSTPPSRRTPRAASSATPLGHGDHAAYACLAPHREYGSACRRDQEVQEEVQGQGEGQEAQEVHQEGQAAPRLNQQPAGLSE